jgi:hypothetical protein
MSIYYLFIQDTLKNAQNNFIRHLLIIIILPQRKLYLDKMSLDTKRGKPFVITKGGIPIKIVWPNPHPFYHSMCG